MQFHHTVSFFQTFDQPELPGKTFLIDNSHILNPPYKNVPLLLWSLFTLIPSLAVTCRRLHDTSKSGILLLLYLVPLIGSIILLIYCCEDSQRGTNQYGPSEKYPELP